MINKFLRFKETCFIVIRPHLVSGLIISYAGLNQQSHRSSRLLLLNTTYRLGSFSSRLSKLIHSLLQARLILGADRYQYLFGSM